MVKQINVFVPKEKDLKYRDDPAVGYQWFSIDRSKDPRQDAQELEKRIDEFLNDKEKVAVEYMGVRDSGRLVGGGFAVHYKSRDSPKPNFI